jgi:hypothetical protein
LDRGDGGFGVVAVVVGVVVDVVLAAVTEA